MRIKIAGAIAALVALVLLAIYAGVMRTPLAVYSFLSTAQIAPKNFLIAGWLLAGAVSLAPVEKSPLRARLRLLLALATWVALLLVFRDRQHALGDSAALLRDPVRRVEAGGFYTYLDELVGMWLPLKLARLFVLAGWPTVDAILTGYRIVSLASGIAFFLLAVRAAVDLPEPRFALAMLLGAAHTLHFAGYVENYQASSVLLSAGLLLATAALRRGVADARAIATTTICFCAAVVFHAVAVWSVFALAYLALQSGEFVRTTARNVGIALAILVPVFCAFEFWLTPGVGFAHAHAAGLYEMFATTLRTRLPSVHAYFLLRVATAPLLAILLALAASPRETWRRLRERDAIFAQLYLLGFFIHQLVWKTTIGYQRDWDLFGYTWLPLTYLAIVVTPPSLLLRGALVAIQFLTGIGWLLAQAN